jgi:hypothetical protein
MMWALDLNSRTLPVVALCHSDPISTSHKPSTSSQTSSRTSSSRGAALSANAMSSYVSSRRSKSSTKRLCLTISMPSITKVCPIQVDPETPFMTSVAQVKHSVAQSSAQRRTFFPSSAMTLHRIFRPTTPPTAWSSSVPVAWRACQGDRESTRNASCHQTRSCSTARLTQSRTSLARRCAFVTTTFQRHITVAVEGVRRSSPDYYPVASETGHSLRIAPVLASLGHHHETQVTQPRQLVHVLLDILL